MDDEGWRLSAACRGMDPALFHPGQREQISAEVVDTCAGCQVRADCLDHALRFETHGYWAGTTAHQREKLREARGIVLERLEYRPFPKDVCGTSGGWQRHRRRGEDPCGLCREAWARYNQPVKRAWRARKRETDTTEAEEQASTGVRRQPGRDHPGAVEKG